MVDLHNIDLSNNEKSISKINEKEFFYAGLQYAPPARGVWNIVHIGFLMPESHQIFVCAQGCIRGVVLTAHEAKLEKRFSTVVIQERNIIDGDMEYQIIDGVSDIINRLDYKPKAIEVFTSCIHYFSGCDLDFVYKKLRQKFSDILFIDCYMTPITRKSGITPDEKMRMQLYSLISDEKKDVYENSITIIGNVYTLDETSDFRKILSKANINYLDITQNQNWQDYQNLGKSKYFIYTNPAAKKSCEYLAKRLNKACYFFPYSYTKSEIKKYNKKLCQLIDIKDFETDNIEKIIEKLIIEMKKLLKDYSIVLDYTATPRILNLTRFLLDLNLNVTKVYLDSINEIEKDDFNYLRENYKNLIFSSPTHPASRFLNKRESKNVLAIGQKAAYYENTPYFVNLIEGNSYWGFDGLEKLIKDLIDSTKNKKDVSSMIQIKGWGCNCD